MFNKYAVCFILLYAFTVNEISSTPIDLLNPFRILNCSGILPFHQSGRNRKQNPAHHRDKRSLDIIFDLFKLFDGFFYNYDYYYDTSEDMSEDNVSEPQISNTKPDQPNNAIQNEEVVASFPPKESELETIANEAIKDIQETLAQVVLTVTAETPTTSPIPTEAGQE